MRRKKPRPRRVLEKRRRIAIRRIKKLTRLVFSTYKEAIANGDRELVEIAREYGVLLRRIAHIHKVKVPEVVEMFTCPKCKNVVFPGANAEVVGRKIKCLICGNERDHRLNAV